MSTSRDDATAQPSVPGAFDLLSPKTFADGHPFALYDAMRARGPILRHPGAGDVDSFWVLTNYDDIRAVSHDTDRWSSADGFNINIGPARKRSDIAKAIGRNIIAFDPPEHGEFKRVLMPAFTPPRLKILEEKTRDFVRDLVASLDGRSDIEFVREVASLVPIRLLCNLLGIPREDEPKILAWTNLMVGSSDPDLVPDPAAAFAAYMEVFAYGKWLVEKRLAEPTDDLMSMVAHGQLGGAPMDDATRDGTCATLIAAGNETTRNAITAAIMLMTEAPDLRRQLAQTPDLMPAAIEEFLRRATPVIHMARTAKTDIELAGETVRAGEKVAMLYGGANHDPAVFDDPYAIRLDRPSDQRHLAFGTGIHLCIGQRLAQMEMRVLLPELLAAFPDIEAVAAPRYLLSNFVSGIKELPVRLNRRH